MLDWDIAVYVLNEERRLRDCLVRVAASIVGSNSRIVVLLNGSRDGSIDVACKAARDGLPIEIHRIEAGDKSNTINQFLHHIRRPSRAVGAVDGYAYIGPRSFPAMLARLDERPDVMATTGVCLNGRTMKLATQATLTKGGQLHGQLHGLRGSFVDRMVARGIRLPVGTYWGDGLLCSMAAHDLDAISQPWVDQRVSGVADATYTIPELSVFKPGDVRRHLRRRVRQMTGRLQTAAIKDLIYRKGYNALPAHADDMVRTYLLTHPPPPMHGLDRWFQHLALRNLRTTAPLGPRLLLSERVQP